MKNRLCPLFFIAALSLTACGGKSYSPKDYMLELEYTGNFKILQLTDTHIADKDDQDLHYAFLDLLIKDANKANDLDFIVVTGDLFTFAGKATARRYCDFLDSYGIPWSVVFGNHDEQTYFSVDWWTNYLNNYGSNCYFKDIQDDDVAGNCNFAINLKKGGVVTDQLIMMDSNRYYFGDYMGYDYFKKSQIDWYSELVDQTAADNGGVVNSLMFYHIPLPEVNDAYEKGTLIYGEKREDCCPPDQDLGFFDIIKAKGSTSAMFFGHDHINNFEADYEGVKFCYGIKSTNRIYFDEDMLGYQTIEIKDDHKVEIVRSYHTYGEVR
ncbi:MAG: metallophosphoesterase [Bacilli bacterium]|nr:metallophosphoesterase [Bacilli bacterium]